MAGMIGMFGGLAGGVICIPLPPFPGIMGIVVPSGTGWIAMGPPATGALNPEISPGGDEKPEDDGKI